MCPFILVLADIRRRGSHLYFSESSGAGGGVICNEACKIILACIISLKIYIYLKNSEAN